VRRPSAGQSPRSSAATSLLDDVLFELPRHLPLVVTLVVFHDESLLLGLPTIERFLLFRSALLEEHASDGGIYVAMFVLVFADKDIYRHGDLRKASELSSLAQV